MMANRAMKFCLALALVLLAPLAAADVEVAGVNFPEKVTLADSQLSLNGVGLRARFFIKVYAMAIYLGEKKSSATEALAVRGAKRIHIVTLRELSAEDFAKALVEGIHKNYDDAAFAALKSRTEALQQTILSLKSAAKGGQIQLDWLPASGTRLSFNGEKRGDDIPGEDFYRALLAIWLGEHPAAQDLKDGLLGKPQ